MCKSLRLYVVSLWCSPNRFDTLWHYPNMPWVLKGRGAAESSRGTRQRDDRRRSWRFAGPVLRSIRSQTPVIDSWAESLNSPKWEDLHFLVLSGTFASCKGDMFKDPDKADTADSPALPEAWEMSVVSFPRNFEAKTNKDKTWQNKLPTFLPTLGLQVSSKKVLQSVFRRLSTFLEGIWSPRASKQPTNKAKPRDKRSLRQTQRNPFQVQFFSRKVNPLFAR